MKHIKFTAIFLMMTAGAADAQTPDYSWYAGKSSPYTISTADELAGLAAIVNGTWGGEPAEDDFAGKTVILGGDDIDLSGYAADRGWTPIGTFIAGSGFYSFKGTFDGKGKKITGLRINVNTRDFFGSYSGLFGSIDGGTVKNLGVYGSIISGTHVGGIAGALRSFDGTPGNILNSHFIGDIMGMEAVGGIVGMVSGGSRVEECYSDGTINDINYDDGGSYIWHIVTRFFGGVVGYLDEGSIRNCYSASVIDDATESVGGIAGIVEPDGEVTGCYYVGAVVSGEWYVGGIAGYVNGGRVASCAALNSTIKARHDAAGRVVGINDGGTLFDNIAFDGMVGISIDYYNPVLSSIVGIPWNSNGPNGRYVTLAELYVDWWFFPDALKQPPWTYAAGSLPGFGAPVSMPEHLQPFDGGDGSSDNPYEIRTAQQLANLAGLVNVGSADYSEKQYKLTADIDLGGGLDVDVESWNRKMWTPIGGGWWSDGEFTGIFDGNNKKITGLYINDWTHDPPPLTPFEKPGYEPFGYKDEPFSHGPPCCDDIYQMQGLFGKITGGTVKNLGVYGSIIVTAYHVGGIVGELTSGTITNSYFIGDVDGAYHVGGIAGNVEAGSDITNCYSVGTVNGMSRVGGIAGNVGGSRVTNNAALNSSVKGFNDFGRVAGVDSAGTFTGNFAFEMMSTSGGPDFGGNPVLDGAGKTYMNLQIASGFPAALTQLPWTYAPGSLPGLGSAVNMPDYLRPVVSSIKILQTGLIMKKGDKQQFTAEVEVVNGAPTDVIWSVSNQSGAAAVSTIDSDGLLTITANETADILTVKAVSAFDNNKYDASTVVLKNVKTVTVSPDGPQLNRGATFTFNVTVDGHVLDAADKAVNWSVSGSTNNFTFINTVNSSSAQLTIAPNESALSITVTATSVFDNSKFGTVSVTVLATDINDADEIKLINDTYTYTGDSIKPAVAVIYREYETLVLGTHYTVRYENNVNASTVTDSARAVIVGRTAGGFKDSAVVKFAIGKKAPAPEDLSFTIPADYVYNGEPQGIDPSAVKLRNGLSGLGTVSLSYGNSLTPQVNAGTYDILAIITEGSNFTAANIPLGSYTISQAPGAPALRPQIASSGDGSFTLVLQETPATDQSFEYGINDINSAPTQWQNALTFTNIDIDATYFVFARTKANDNYKAGSPSPSLQLRILADGTIWTSIAEHSRVIPNQRVDKADNAVSYVNTLTSEFTAGPNPVSKSSSGVVNFFWHGKSIKSGMLTVYDASGNMISRIAVSDRGGAINGLRLNKHGRARTDDYDASSRRVVGSWDLRDLKGRPVSEGTYLVKGVITAIDGKKEKVSLIIGIR